MPHLEYCSGRVPAQEESQRSADAQEELIV